MALSLSSQQAYLDEKPIKNYKYFCEEFVLQEFLKQNNIYLIEWTNLTNIKKIIRKINLLDFLQYNSATQKTIFSYTYLYTYTDQLRRKKCTLYDTNQYLNDFPKHKLV